MPGGKGNIKPEDGKQFSEEYQPDNEIWIKEVADRSCTDLLNWIKDKDENNLIETLEI